MAGLRSRSMTRCHRETKNMTEAIESDTHSGRTLIFVHGRYFKPAAAELMDVSAAAMTAAIARDYPDKSDDFAAVDKRIAYYGDLSNTFLKTHGEIYDELLDIGDRRNALQRLKTIDKRKNFSVGRYDRLPGKTAIAEFTAGIAGPILETLGLSKKVIEKIAVDLGEYWNEDSDFSSQVRARVRNEICAAMEQSSRLMLISHGTGCIVAYDVLWQISHDPEYREQFEQRKIDLWLTLGAPLGDSAVRKRLKGAELSTKEQYPSNIVSWHNVSAEDDYMSHDNTVADDFKGMLAYKLVSSIRDYRIYNLAVHYGKSNPHSSVGYLIHPRVAQIIAEWLS